MKLVVMDMFEAGIHKPDDATGMIRIYGKDSDELFFDLQDGYSMVAHYGFDYVSPGRDLKGRSRMDSDLAEQIVTDFAEHFGGCERVIVHCFEGMNRSPAVAMALNEIFDLGADAEELRKKYPEADMHAYETLMQVAGQLDRVA